VFKPTHISAEYMTLFHSDEYVEFLRSITPDNQVPTSPYMDPPPAPVPLGTSMALVAADAQLSHCGCSVTRTRLLAR